MDARRPEQLAGPSSPGALLPGALLGRRGDGHRPLGVAPRVANAPQVDLREGIKKAGGKKKQRAAMHSEFAQIKAAGDADGGGGLLRVAVVADGGGRSARARSRPEPDFQQPARAGRDDSRPHGADGARGDPTGPSMPIETERRRGGAGLVAPR